MCRYSWRPEVIRCSGTRVSGSCTPPDTDAGNTTLVLCRVVIALNLRVISPVPQTLFSKEVI